MGFRETQKVPWPEHSSFSLSKRSCKHLPYFQSYLHLPRIFSVWFLDGLDQNQALLLTNDLDSRILVLILVAFSWRPQSHIFPNITELKSSPGFHSAWSWWSRMGTGDTRSLWLPPHRTWSSVPSYWGINKLFSNLSFLSKQGFLFPIHFLSSLWAGPGRHLWFCFTSPNIPFVPLSRQGFDATLLWASVLTGTMTSWPLPPHLLQARGALLKEWWLLESPSHKLLGYPQMSSEQSASSEQMGPGAS